MAAHALEGLRFIEFTDEVGAYCGKLLADLGAEVIKVEPPEGGRLRHRPPFIHDAPASVNTSLAFWVWNTSKKSVVLDLDDAAGQEQARQLILSAHGYIDDNPPGYLAAHGIDYEELRAQKPSLIYTSITGFGQTGPHAGYAYTDLIGQAMSGVLTLSGFPEDPPQQLAGEQGSMSASVQAAQGTLFAAMVAERDGVGQIVEVSMQESMSMSQETAMQTWDLQKRNRVRTGARGSLAIVLPGLGLYECQDGYIMNYVLAPAGEGFDAMVAWMADEGKADDLTDEPYRTICTNFNMRFFSQLLADPAEAQTLRAQLEHVQEVTEAFFRSLPAQYAFEEGQRRRLLIGLVSTPQDIANSPQMRARDWFVELEVPEAGHTVEWPGAPYRLSRAPVDIRRAPRLGEHNNEVPAALTRPAG